MKSPIFSRQTLTGSTAFLFYFALAKLLIHLYTNAFAGYGIFRDELYYVACSEHLSAGYVDQPPFSIFLLAVSRLIFGDSIFAIRLFPAVAGAATVFLTGLMARELGGGRFAQALASVASIVSLIHIAFNSVYSMNAFDILLWASSSFILIRLIKTGDKKYWMHLGLVLGLGLLNKVSVLWLGFGILAGMVLTPERRWLKTEHPYTAGMIAFALFLPYILWNATHGLADLEFIRNASADKYSSQTPITFLLGQIIIQNPVTLPLWLSGLVWFLISREEKRFRMFAYLFIAVILVLVVNGHSKPEYGAAAYSLLFAGGAVALERWLSAPMLTWMKPAYMALTVAGIGAAPAVIGILPVESYIRYAAALGITPNTPEGKRLDKLPQFYADMFGWEEKAAAVAKVYHALPAEDQAKCAIYGDNYGRCAAIDFYSKKYHLPKAIGGHNNYWIWGPHKYTGEVVIILGGDLKKKAERFETVIIADTVHTEYAMPYENDLPIYVCRNLKGSLKELWPLLKHYE